MFSVSVSAILLRIEFCFLDVIEGFRLVGKMRCSGIGGQQVMGRVEMLGMLLAMIVEVFCNHDPVPWHEKISMSGIAAIVPLLIISAKYASILSPASFFTPIPLLTSVFFPACRSYVTSVVFTMNAGFLCETTTGHFTAVVTALTARVAIGLLMVVKEIDSPLLSTSTWNAGLSSTTLTSQQFTDHRIIIGLLCALCVIQAILIAVCIIYIKEILDYLDQLRIKFNEEWKKMLDEKLKKDDDAVPLMNRADDVFNTLTRIARSLAISFRGRRDDERTVQPSCEV